MRKLIFTNRKGGSGKTTVAINLAVSLARRKRKILFVDLDSQAHATFFFLNDLEENPKTVLDFLDGKVAAQDLPLATRYERITLLPSDQRLAEINERFNENYFFLRDIVERWNDRYDFMIIDVPPSLEKSVYCGLVAADEIFIPLQMHFLPLKGVAQLFQLVLNLNRELNPGLKVAGFIPTLYNERTRIYRSVLEDLSDNFPPEMILPGIPYDIKLAEAPSFRKSIFEYAPRSKASQAFLTLEKKILKMEG